MAGGAWWRGGSTVAGGARWQGEHGGRGWLLSGIHSQGAGREQQKDQAVELKVGPPWTTFLRELPLI